MQRAFLFSLHNDTDRHVALFAMLQFYIAEILLSVKNCYVSSRSLIEIGILPDGLFSNVQGALSVTIAETIMPVWLCACIYIQRTKMVFRKVRD